MTQDNGYHLKQKYREIEPNDFNIQNNLTFNFTKSCCIMSIHRFYKLLCLTFYMDTERLDCTDSIKYIGFTFISDKKDANDMLRQIRILTK